MLRRFLVLLMLICVVAGAFALPVRAATNDWNFVKGSGDYLSEFSIYADAALDYSTSSAIFADATGAGLFNNAPGLALTNRWDNCCWRITTGSCATRTSSAGGCRRWWN